MESGSGDMTLAFELGALEALANPTEVFSDARGWTEYIGVISDEPTYVVTNFTRKNRIRQDFFSGPRGRRESLANVKRQFDTARHVFVGTGENDRTLADDVDWEFLAIDAAAEAAGWDLAPDDDEESPVPETRDDWP